MVYFSVILLHKTQNALRLLALARCSPLRGDTANRYSLTILVILQEKITIKNWRNVGLAGRIESCMVACCNVGSLHRSENNVLFFGISVNMSKKIQDTVGLFVDFGKIFTLVGDAGE